LFAARDIILDVTKARIDQRAQGRLVGQGPWKGVPAVGHAGRRAPMHLVHERVELHITLISGGYPRREEGNS
jgi:hypothetical protein